MKKILKIFTLTIMVLLFICVISILSIQEDAFFHPWHDAQSYTELLKIQDFKEIKIDNDGKLIHGWFYNNGKTGEEAPLLLFFGGNAQNSSNTCLSFLQSDIYQYFNGYNFMIVDYPSYGLSEGKISDITMFDTALKTYDYATQLEDVDEDKIVVMGYSIGTGVATYTASQRNVNGLILLSPYDEALSLYNDTLNIFHGPLKVLAKYKFKSIEYAPDVKVAPIIFTSYADEVINYNDSLNLANYFNEVEDIIILDKVKHAYYFSQEEVLNKINAYLLNKL